MYATAGLTVSNSVFVDNRVTGGDGATGVGRRVDRSRATFVADNGATGAVVDDLDGGSAGDALGADIAIGDAGLATIANTRFDGSTAVGGNGGIGLTSDETKNGTRPPRPDAGADGECRRKDRGKAEGGNGRRGFPGEPGGQGGDAGDAVGAISAGRFITLTGVTITGATATTGTAGGFGVPSLGGPGSNGGDGVACSKGGGFGGLGSETWSGRGGDGGDSGDQGRAFPPGDRGDAIAGVDADYVEFTNVTIHDVESTVQGTVVDEFAGRADAIAAISVPNDAETTLGGRPGSGGGSEPDGRLASAGDASRIVLFTRSDVRNGASAGSASAVRTVDEGPGTQRSRVAFSTIADVDVAVPLATDGGGRDEADAGAFVFATTGTPKDFSVDVESSVFSDVGTASCPHLFSLVNVVEPADGCVTVRGDDVVFPGAGAVATDLADGPVIATDGSGREWRASGHCRRGRGCRSARTSTRSTSATLRSTVRRGSTRR